MIDPTTLDPLSLPSLPLNQRSQLPAQHQQELAAEDYSEWIEEYLNALPRHRGVLIHIKNKWRDSSLNAFMQWLRTGSLERLKYMKFCDLVLERLADRFGV